MLKIAIKAFHFFLIFGQNHHWRFMMEGPPRKVPLRQIHCGMKTFFKLKILQNWFLRAWKQNITTSAHLHQKLIDAWYDHYVCFCGHPQTQRNFQNQILSSNSLKNKFSRTSTQTFTGRQFSMLLMKTLLPPDDIMKNVLPVSGHTTHFFEELWS